MFWFLFLSFNSSIYSSSRPLSRNQTPLSQKNNFSIEKLLLGNLRTNRALFTKILFIDQSVFSTFALLLWWIMRILKISQLRRTIRKLRNFSKNISNFFENTKIKFSNIRKLRNFVFRLCYRNIFGADCVLLRLYSLFKNFILISTFLCKQFILWKNSLPEEWIPRQTIISREKPIPHESRSDECDIGFSSEIWRAIRSSGSKLFSNRIAKGKLHYWTKPDVSYFSEPHQCANNEKPYSAVII